MSVAASGDNRRYSLLFRWPEYRKTRRMLATRRYLEFSGNDRAPRGTREIF